MYDFSEGGYNRFGDNMINDREMLASILKITQTGQIGIRCVLDASMRPGLRKALQAQLQEYNAIEAETCAVASQRGWELKELQPGRRMLSDMLIRMKLGHGNADSRIADMMIHHNVQGMIKGLKDLHQYPHQDSQVSSLSQRLLDCETANIRQMQPFL